MLILDHQRALDYVIAASSRPAVPEEFSRIQPPAPALEALGPNLVASPEPARAAPYPALASMVADMEAPPFGAGVAAGKRGAWRANALASWWRGFTTPAPSPG